jgi:hypothetical protein
MLQTGLKMNHELALRQRWLRIVEAALEYEEEKLAEATIALPELTPKTPVFKPSLSQRFINGKP